MTLLVEKTEAAPVVEDEAPNNLAPWHIRAAALALDVLPGVAVVATMALVWLAVPPRSIWWWVSVSILVVAALLTMANRVVFPPLIGWSLGRALLGIEVVGPDGSPVGVGRLMAREVAHLLDTLSMLVGWLWPLWDSRRRTFADLLLRTEVQWAQPVRRPVGIRRNAARVVSAAVLLCVAGAGMSILAIYLPDRASERSRNEVNAQGPKIVAQLLTYDAKSLKADFARAQSLTSDRYRPELVKQQESVQKGHPGVNEYWVTDSTVLSATPDKATMLLFMQGHRGAANEQRFITATVQVAFVKGAKGSWLVDDLTVVTKPKPAQGQK
ncbi:RDD family protein [Mycobacterium cookii]|uniref:Membrane protein n=1 Tax=Mycobacterium cookii TaxID=1775 RepID=A0A7I7KZH1_9MYCO|nr:RDD family protein [Mycobacterium cookii]MCV7330329.1 RDD family protein [Mycobacterium cookii]BBX47485.1 membrane protein [Mycobacterium cookii]